MEKFYVCDPDNSEWNTYPTEEDAQSEFDAALEFWKQDAFSEGEWGDGAAMLCMGPITKAVRLVVDGEEGHTKQEVYCPNEQITEAKQTIEKLENSYKTSTKSFAELLAKTGHLAERNKVLVDALTRCSLSRYNAQKEAILALEQTGGEGV